MDLILDTSPPAEPVFLPRRSRWVVGVDLGQSMDPTAICVLEHVRGVLDANSDWERHANVGRIPQKPAERFNVRHLERLKLGIPYPDIVEHVRTMVARAPLCGDGDQARPATIVIDETGVGRAVGDIFESAGLRPMRITITAGAEVACVGYSDGTPSRFHVAKTILISHLDALLHIGELKFAAELSEAGAMKGELLDFRRSVSAAGRSTYQARTGAHDDLVLSTAIAVWWARRPEPQPLQFGTYGL